MGRAPKAANSGVCTPDRAAHRRADPKKPRRGRVARLLKSCLQRVGSACASTEQAQPPQLPWQDMYTRLRARSWPFSLQAIATRRVQKRGGC